MSPADVKYWLGQGEAQALPKAAAAFDTFLDEPPSDERNMSVREFRHTAYPQWKAALTALRTPSIALEALELVAMLPATRGVYLLDQQDMDFVKRAVKALKEQA